MSVFEHHDIFDPDTAPAGDVDAGLNRKDHALVEGIFRGWPKIGGFMHFETDAVAEPMAESAMAPRNPPWTMPAGLANRSSARIRHTVRPGRDFSTQVIPRVSSQLGGTWIRWSATM